MRLRCHCLACSLSCSSPINSALIPTDLRYLTWSCIREARGEITSAIDFAFDNSLIVSKTIGADWKINDFPDPVGWITNTSWPPTSFSSASRCESFKFLSLKDSKTRSKAKFILSTSSAMLTTLFWCDSLCENLARRKTAGGNLIGWTNKGNITRPAALSGGWVRAHFPEQRLEIEPIRLPPFFKFACFCNLICLKVSRLNFTEKTDVSFH